MPGNQIAWKATEALRESEHGSPDESTGLCPFFEQREQTQDEGGRRQVEHDPLLWRLWTTTRGSISLGSSLVQEGHVSRAQLSLPGCRPAMLEAETPSSDSRILHPHPDSHSDFPETP